MAEIYFLESDGHDAWVRTARKTRVRKGDDNDWELKLDPPVNSVLPVGREHVAGLRRVLGF